ncbi:MAG: transposase [Candidatus Helarchaeota archaeon]
MNRNRWTFEEKLQIVLAMLAKNETVSEICHHHRVSETQAYWWRDQFLEGSKKTLNDGCTGKDRDALVEENQKLKGLVGSQVLIIEVQKKVSESLSIRAKRKLVDTMRRAGDLNQTQTLQVIGLVRSTYHY